MSDVYTKIDWGEFQGGTALLPICVRSPNVQGRNLLAMLEAAAERADNVVLVLCDALDRHNLGDDLELAMRQSAEWQQRYLPDIKAVFPRYELMDWQSICRERHFNANHRALQNLYCENPEVKAAIDINVAHYVRPKINRRIREKGWEVDPTPLF